MSRRYSGRLAQSHCISSRRLPRLPRAGRKNYKNEKNNNIYISLSLSPSLFLSLSLSIYIYIYISLSHISKFGTTGHEASVATKRGEARYTARRYKNLWTASTARKSMATDVKTQDSQNSQVK